MAPDDAITLPAWAIYLQLHGRPHDDPELVGWMRSRPDSVKALLLQLPPGCIVRANRKLASPAPGYCGIVYSYRECGTVTVVHHPSEMDLIWTGNVRGECNPAWLEVVGFEGGMTREWVASILGPQHA